MRYHSLAGVSVPSALRVTATADDGLVMAVTHDALPQWGVQFHPESILTTHGERMLGNFLTLAHAPVTAATPAKAAAPEPPVSFAGLREHPHWIDPDRLAPVLLAGRDRAFWLDSADARPWTGRFSVMGYLDDDGRSIAVGNAQDGDAVRERVPRAGFLARLRELEAELEPTSENAPPAVGGWVGVAGYETQELLPDEAAGSPADGFFLRVDRAVVWDHESRRMFLHGSTNTHSPRSRPRSTPSRRPPTPIRHPSAQRSRPRRAIRTAPTTWRDSSGCRRPCARATRTRPCSRSRARRGRGRAARALPRLAATQPRSLFRVPAPR